ncbi:MAG: hypothetical protein K6A90_00195 [Lachnospiraceae bacterium]|nr:hypothetical protein [Lachnospiraceae bacterium]
MRKKSVIMIFILSLSLSGCIPSETNVNVAVKPQEAIINDEETDKRAAEKGEEYRKYFEGFLSAGQESIEKTQYEQYKKDYWLLMVDFISGGFTTQQNLDYLNGEYPQEYYQYCLEDLNDDGVPEFMLGYGYNGADPYNWEIYKTGNSYKECFVGTAMHIDRERKVVFDETGMDLTSYMFDGEKLVRKEAYYADYEECTDGLDPEEVRPPVYYYDDGEHEVKKISEKEFREGIASYSEKDNTNFEGKRLGTQNLVEDLQIDRNEWMRESALRSYLGYLRFCIQNRNIMTSYRYSLARIDDDDIPEMVTFNGERHEIWYYMNGKMLRQESSDNEGGNEHYTSYFPGKNMIRSYSAEWGSMQEEYYTFKGEMLECPLVAVRESVTSSFTNEFMKDSKGNFLYNYCVNDELVSGKEYEKIMEVLFDVFELEEEIRFMDMETSSFDDMMTRLEKETGSH